MERLHGIVRKWKKTRLVASKNKQFNELEEKTKKYNMEKYVYKTAEVLGVVTSMGQANRKMEEKEEARCQRVKKMTHRLKTLPVGRYRRRLAYRMFIASALSYGWVAKKIPIALEKRITNEAFKAINSGANRLGSRALKCVIEGAMVAPECVIGVRMVGVEKRAIDRKATDWNNIRGTLNYTNRKFMKEQGWEETGEKWEWKRQIRVDNRNEEIKINLENGEKKIEEIKHDIRESYRQKAWKEFCQEERRDSKQIKEAGEEEYPIEPCEVLRTRTNTPEYRAVMLGSFRSVAAAAAAYYHQGILTEKERDEEMRCPWCKNGIADWNHCMWECEKREKKIQKPKNIIQQRMAWPMSKDKKYNEEIIKAAEEVVKKTWKYSYGKSGFDSEVLERHVQRRREEDRPIYLRKDEEYIKKLKEMINKQEALTNKGKKRKNNKENKKKNKIKKQ